MKDFSRLDTADLLADPGKALRWLEDQPASEHQELASYALEVLLKDAAQPKTVSGNACLRLCKFVETCAKSQSSELRQWASSQKVVEALFNFYIDCDESDHHRSMRLALEVVFYLLKENPDAEAVNSIKATLLTSLVSIITGKDTRPAAKSAIKTLDYFLAKNIITLDALSITYAESRSPLEAQDGGGEGLDLFSSLFAEISHWLRVHTLSQATGKLMVSLYRALRRKGSTTESVMTPEILLQWLLSLLENEPSLLETVKLNIFQPLFKLDRDEAVTILQTVIEHEALLSKEDLSLDVLALLQLTILETGKKVGLVEEPGFKAEQKSSKKALSLILDERIVANVLAHTAHDVRSLAFSLLITSPSTTKPFSSTALSLLEQHLASYFADPDAKFRGDVMAKARQMFKRVRGAICLLKRSLSKAKAKAKTREQKAANSPLDGGSVADRPDAGYRTNLVVEPEADLEDCLKYHGEYLAWYIRYLRDELVPTASYQRHVASLKSLSSVLRMEGDSNKAWETPEDQQLFFDLLDETWARALFDLIMNSFDDVRELASANLQALLSDKRYRNFSLHGSSQQVQIADELTDLLRRAHRLAHRTSRADHSDGAARVCQLVYRFSSTDKTRISFLTEVVGELESKLRTAAKDLGAAVLEAPVHGDFAALRYIWQSASEMKLQHEDLVAFNALQERVIACCEEVWSIVIDILCDDSPEGHLPQELEELDGLNTKDVLSYSFRAIHESSNLMRHIVLSLPNRLKKDLVYPSRDQFARIGNLTFQQLSFLRHRGAFTTVAQTFATCCQQTKHLQPDQVENDESLLHGWFKGTMDTIYSQASTTRRSAGIPSLMTGILSANAAYPSFETIMEDLMAIAATDANVRVTDGTHLPQVHAFNCLKDIFKSSLLTTMGNKAEKYLPQCLELAAAGLKSEAWAIRNCGLILIRSLIDNLIGTNDSKAVIESGWDGKANRISYQKYETLPHVLLNLLKSGHEMMTSAASESMRAESVFPALEIIRRSGPPDALRGEIQTHIALYLASPVWHVREMAARTLCSCLLHEGWLENIRARLAEAMDSTTKPSTLNHIHGVLLTLKFVLERLGEVSPDRLRADLPNLIALLGDLRIDQQYVHCPEIQAAYLEVINMVSRYHIRWPATLGSAEKLPTSACRVSGSALLNIQLLLSDVYSASSNSSPGSRLKESLLEHKYSVNTLVPALELLPELFDVSATKEETLADLCGFYIDCCLSTIAVEVQTIALENLAVVLDHLSKQSRFDLLESLPFSRLWTHLPPQSISPSLSQALTRVSGCMIAILSHTGVISKDGLRVWGSLISEAVQDDKDFDDRFAAAKSLESFFAVRGTSCSTDDYLSPLIALYDILNDDDDEVRDVGAAAAKHILGHSLVPIEAATSLLTWLSQTFKASTAFRDIAAARIVGHHGLLHAENGWIGAEDQLDAALAFDDSLFAIEETNLFIDEVREAQRWRKVFEALDWAQTEVPISKLNEWLARGLIRLQRMMDEKDGSLGWASDPHVFAICARLLLGSSALVEKGHASKELSEGLENIRASFVTQNQGQERVSGLLAGLL